MCSFLRVLTLAAFLLPSLAVAAVEQNRQQEFAHFSLDLPPGWDGDEQKGFISDDPAEYLLTLGHKDDEGDNFIAQVSIYLLPNKQGVNAKTAAQTLAEAQGDATEPEQDGPFWRFMGEPRTRTIKGRATTYVNANAELMLIIIAQDPQNLGAGKIVSSLKGITPEAIKLLAN